LSESHQIRTYFGIPVPPFNEDSIKMGSGALTLRFFVTGRLPSKKNTQTIRLIMDKAIKYLGKANMVSLKMAIAALYKVYVRFLGNEEYKKFVEKNKEKLLKQMLFYKDKFGEKGLVFPISRAQLTVKFYFKDLYVQDLSNKLETIQDLLVACKVVEDDNYNVLNPVYIMGKCFKDEITQNIAEICITIPNLNRNEKSSIKS